PTAAEQGNRQARKPGSAAPVLEQRGWLLGAGVVVSIRSASAHRPPEPRGLLWDERLASCDFRCAAGQRFENGSAVVHALRAASGGKRLRQRHADLRTHADAAAMARMAQ